LEIAVWKNKTKVVQLLIQQKINSRNIGEITICLIYLLIWKDQNFV
jgi:hypothetical protein